MDITKPDNDADVVVSIKISGNALVSILNTLDGIKAYALLSEYQGKYDWTHEITEQIRDQLSEQRCALRK